MASEASKVTGREDEDGSDEMDERWDPLWKRVAATIKKVLSSFSYSRLASTNQAKRGTREMYEKIK